MSSIEELTALVRAGLDEDEQTAQRAGSGSWHVECSYEYGECQPGCECRHRRIEGDGEPGITIYDEGGHDEDQADHIVRHDPARILAEVAAKRALLDQALAWHHLEAGDPWYACMAATKEREGFWHPDRDEPQRGFTLEQWQACGCGRDDHLRAVLEFLATPYNGRGAA